MDTRHVDRTVALLNPDELRDVLGFVDTREKAGQMSPQEAEQWREPVREEAGQ